MKYYTVLLVNAFFAVALAQKAFNSQKQQQQYQQQPQQQQQYQQQPQQQQQQKQVVVESKYRNIPIVQLENTQDHDGSFKYSFEDGEGTKVQQNGQLKYVNQESAGEAVQGGYSYTGDDGKVYSLSYTADENGYRPVGDFLPTPPPVPEAIARAVEYLKSLPPHKEPGHN